ncbi:MaoC family dehydratase N-terminal domain-containing protein [Nocardioides convexus]|uniref:FAS1-like dehydratase domain-containing protein n=1 Tax=Nocardioides convexus TaxID=2712224 RepID=UPI00241872B6|nr:MaoC family dehydratase N-terminal domain-containing protein [Nocardioides convexus]
MVTFAALQDFLAAEQVELSRIVHGDQRFRYARPVVVGDEPERHAHRHRRPLDRRQRHRQHVQ